MLKFNTENSIFILENLFSEASNEINPTEQQNGHHDDGNQVIKRITFCFGDFDNLISIFFNVSESGEAVSTSRYPKRSLAAKKQSFNTHQKRQNHQMYKSKSQGFNVKTKNSPSVPRIIVTEVN